MDDIYPQNPDGPTDVPGPGILTNDTVPCGAAVEVSLVSPPKHGEVTLNVSGGFTYVPKGAPMFDMFTYEIYCPDFGLVSTLLGVSRVDALARPAAVIRGLHSLHLGRCGQPASRCSKGIRPLGCLPSLQLPPATACQKCHSG